MRFLCILLALSALSLTAQTQPPAEGSRIPSAVADSIAVVVGGQLTALPICTDRTGVSCQPGSLYLSNFMSIRTALPPSTGTGSRFRCQDTVIPTATADSVVLQITNTAFFQDSLQVFWNGLLMNPRGFGELKADYIRNGQTITLNRRVDPLTPLIVCYSAPN